MITILWFCIPEILTLVWMPVSSLCLDLRCGLSAWLSVRKVDPHGGPALGSWIGGWYLGCLLGFKPELKVCLSVCLSVDRLVCKCNQ